MFRETACILLAGGGGTRVRHLYPDRPKVLIPVAGRPFLEWVLRYWIRQGVRRFLLSVGHMAEAVEQYVSGAPCGGVEIQLVREPVPLGTGGAIRCAAQSSACTDPFIAANGDSLVFGDFSEIGALLARPEVDGVLAAVEVADAARFGTLRVGANGTLLGFQEKRPGSGWVNAGVYFLKKRLLSRFPERTPLSIESDVFPALIAAGARLHVHRLDGGFLDIGTPEALREADAFIARRQAQLAEAGGGP